MMLRIVCAAFGLQLLIVGSASAQQSTPLKIRGDTTHAPRGCSAAAGVSAIKAWFAAFSDADSARLAKASSTPHGRFVFSIAKFADSDVSIPARTFEELLAYARKRALQHERMTVQQVRFDGWSGRVLQLDSLYFTRSADDLGDKALPGIGKGGYWCRQGVWYFHLVPRRP
jgi:hypothetical protein